MKFHSKPVEEHQEVPLSDDGQWEQLISHWQARHPGVAPRSEGRNACYVVSVSQSPAAERTEARLAEIVALVRAQGDAVVGSEILHRARPDPNTYLGRGASRQIAERAAECGADMLVVDAELSPSQTRNLEDVTALPICDREAVILNVFQCHAKTRKARIQFEIAHLQYLRPRIRGLGLQMDQQAGGIMAGRGPGETASELLARRLDGRLSMLRKSFARLQRAGETQRKSRDECQRVVFVGYTNAGKTSLMNALTGAGLSAKDMPFETLDTTSRCLTRHGGDVVLSDTVGFIRRLPNRLLESFESTLAELCEASVIAVVVDVSDPELEMHLETTEAMIARLGAEQIPRLMIFNKLDRLERQPPREFFRRHSRGSPHVVLSCHDEVATDRLRHSLIALARAKYRKSRVFLPYSASDATAKAYATCRVHEAKATPEGLVLTLEGLPHHVEQIRQAGKERKQS